MLKAGPDSLANDGQDIVLPHNLVFLVVVLDLGPAVLGHENLVVLLHVKRNGLSIVVTLAGAECNNLSFLRLFLGLVGNDDSTLAHFLFVERLNQYPVSQWLDLHLAYYSLWFVNESPYRRFFLRVLLLVIDHFEIGVDDIPLILLVSSTLAARVTGCGLCVAFPFGSRACRILLRLCVEIC